MNKKDLTLILVIGALVGILAQPVASNVIHQTLSLQLRLGLFVLFFIGAPVALYVCLFLSRFVKIAYQFGKFAAIGVLNTFFDIGVFNALSLFIFGTALTSPQFVLLKTTSFIIANLNSYLWNSRWAFENKTSSGSAAPVATTRQAFQFYLVSAIGLGVNVAVAFLVRLAFLNIASPALADNIGIIAATAASMIFNFIGYKFFVFKNQSVKT